MINRDEYEESRIWGMFSVIGTGSGYKVKELILVPKGEISLQKHNHRSEHWLVLEGKGMTIINSVYKSIKIGESIDVPKKATHKLINTSEKENLRIIEVQIGEFLEEDDIIRLD